MILNKYTRKDYDDNNIENIIIYANHHDKFRIWEESFAEHSAVLFGFYYTTPFFCFYEIIHLRKHIDTLSRLFHTTL